VKNAVHTTPNLHLRREREQRGWSQEDVAKKIGAPDDKIVRRWESGKVSSSLHYCQTLCNLYGKSAEELGLIQYDTSPTWNIPYRRNPFFTGREKLLTLLHEKLTTNNAAALTQVQAISGLGGIGKTQIAVEYAYRYRDEYHIVLWVRAAARVSLIADFVTIAGLLHLPEKDEQDQKIVIAASGVEFATYVYSLKASKLIIRPELVALCRVSGRRDGLHERHRRQPYRLGGWR